MVLAERHFLLKGPPCRDFFERSGAGVEPTQRRVAPPHRF
jgi:hypothetical protein